MIERLSWVRLGTFLVFVLVVYLAVRHVNSMAGLICSILGFVIFNVIAFYHRRRIRYKKKLVMWRHLQGTQLARMSCDWDNIPARQNVFPVKSSAFLTDMDITGSRSLFRLMDMTITDRAARQLVAVLGQAAPDPALVKTNQQRVKELLAMPHFRNRLLRQFLSMPSELVQAESVLAWLRVEKPVKALAWMVPAGSVWVVLNILLFLGSVLSLVPPYWILSVSFYVAFHLFAQQTTGRFFEMVIKLDEEVTKYRRVLRVLEKYPLPAGGALAGLCAPFTSRRRPPSRCLLRIKLVTAAVGLRMNPMMNVALNLILPYDFICSYLAFHERKKMVHLLPQWVERFAEFEVLFSLTNFAYLNPEHVFPEIVPENDNRGPVFRVRSLGHPLLPFSSRVSNDFELTKPDQVVMITGSNMSGKSTFLKTIGINFCLAYAGAPVPGKEFVARPYRLFSSLQINDSVTDGLSFFYAEVQRLKALFDLLAAGNELPVFFLVDEIFRGTNNRERKIGSRAVIEALLKKTCTGCISTHDLDLVKLAERFSSVTNYHFRDDIQDGRLVFDYKLRPGPCPTTNAIRIMRMEGLPVGEEG